MSLPILLPHLLLALLFLTGEASGDLPAPLNDEVLGLIVFKSALVDPTGALASWNEADATPCAWPHVACSAVTSRVVGLSLASLSISGPLPRGLDRLPALASLSLADNNLSGPIPPGLSLLPSLRSLDLSRNAFSGRIPDDLALLPSIISLDLSSNALSGPLPTSLFAPSAPTCASLRVLSLAGNRLEGPLPPTLPQCAFLLHLNLSDNGFSGEPPDFSNGLTRLRVLDLSRNSFAGRIPGGVAALHNLKALRLSHNQFYGTIPAGLGLCPHLETIDLSFNSFAGKLPDSIRYLASLSFLNLSNNQLSGDVPAWIGNLAALRHLDLSNNQFAGSLPESIGGMKDLNYLNLGNNLLAGDIPDSVSECAALRELQVRGNSLNGSIPQGLFNLGLEVLDLSKNQLSGQIPQGSKRISETLHALDLSSNQLTGAIPPGMTSYFSLRYLNLSWNELRSPLPPEFGRFFYLTVLDLRSSHVYGAIPGELCESGSLSVLQLDGNSLTGPIPDDIGNCSSLYLLSLSHNNLSGPVPASMVRLKKLEILKLEYNSLSGELPRQLSTLDNLLAANISHNRLIGRLPDGSIFHTLDASALEGNLGLCTPLVLEPCKMDVPKPLMLDPDAYARAHGNDMVAVGATNLAVLRHRKFLSVSSMVAISAALVIASGVLVVTLLNMSARRRIVQLEAALEGKCSSSVSSVGAPAVGKMVAFGPRSSLRSEDFVGNAEVLLSKASEIGRGVFGTVYRASIGGSGGGRTIAIKKLLTANIVQYHDDFDREVRTLAKARHPNLLPLKGYYWTPQLQLLISEYVPHGNLHSRLHESGPPLSWPERLDILVGAANGLAHLHQAFRPPIIHYDLKPTNVLLDERGNPILSDFGLARLLPKLDKDIHAMGGRFQSAVGYMAPELACQSLRVNEKCDVYGFGVLVLEVVTGRRPVEYREDDVVILIDQVRLLLEQGNATECVDPAMGGFPEEEVLPVLKLGLVCASQIPSSRPSMAEVVQILRVIKTPVLQRMEAF